MKKIVISILFGLLLILQACNFNKADLIQMDHYLGSAGIQLKYIVDNNYLMVKSNCDFENCSEKIKYERKLSEKESKELISKINQLKPDTLNNAYINPQILGGFYTEVYFGELIDTNNNKIIVRNVNLKILDSLNKYIDDLILEKKFRLHTFGVE